MDAAELKWWLASVARLTPAQKARLLKALSAMDDEAEVEPLVYSRLAQLPGAPIAPARGSFATALPAACNATSAGLASAPSTR